MMTPSKSGWALVVVVVVPLKRIGLVWASKKLPMTSTMSDEDDDEGASPATAMVVAGCW